MSSGWVAPKASRYTIASTNGNPDSGVTLPLYSCAVSHTKKNKLRAKPHAHVGVLWLRRLVVPGEYIEPCVVFQTHFITIFPSSNNQIVTFP